MGTTQTVPNPENLLEVSKKVFDLDSKKEVEIFKTGNFSPVADMNEFVSRLNNDSAAILKIVNDGLKEFEREKLATAETPWLTSVEGENGEPATQEFTGTAISDEKGKQLNVNVLNFAKLMFGYDDAAKIKDAEERSKARQTAKQKALDMILSNPAAVEALKSAK